MPYFSTHEVVRLELASLKLHMGAAFFDRAVSESAEKKTLILATYSEALPISAGEETLETKEATEEEVSNDRARF
jgi:hypothetical protein